MIATGHLADRIGRKPPVVAGMLLQAAGLAVITAGISRALAAGLAGAFLLGVGTSLVYPTLLAAVSDAAHPAWRAPALGVYRFWRDSGYAIGALIGGVTAVLASLDAAIGGRGYPDRRLRPARLGVHDRDPPEADGGRRVVSEPPCGLVRRLSIGWGKSCARR